MTTFTNTAKCCSSENPKNEKSSK